MVSSYVRRQNLALERFVVPLESSLAEERGVINEAAFQLFRASREESTPVSKLPPALVTTCVQRAVNFIDRFRALSRAPIEPPSEEGILEAGKLAARLERFVELWSPRDVHVFPSFPGCGWLDECAGDILLDTTLTEVKAGAGPFRGKDIRQVLTYVALNSLKRKRDIRSICLVNPRLGLFFKEDLESVCQRTAGCSSIEVLSEIITYVSEPNWRDEAV